MSQTKFIPQSAASKAASNAAFKRFAVKLTELHKANVENAKGTTLAKQAKSKPD